MEISHLTRLPAIDLEKAIVELLPETQAKQNTSIVTLTLRSGQQFTGRLLGLSAKGTSGKTILLQNDERGSTDGITYILLGVVDAVTVHYASEEALVRLSQGNIPKIPHDAPTSLDFKRLLKHSSEVAENALGQPFSYEVDWSSLVENDDDLSSSLVFSVYKEISELIEVLSADTMGREALITKVNRVLIRATESVLPELEIKERTLWINIEKVPAAGLKFIALERLKDAVEKLL